MKNIISIAIFEKNKIYQEQLSFFLNSQSELNVVSISSCCSELIEEISVKTVDVVVLNLTFPFLKILEITQEIRAKFSELIKIIVCNVPFENAISEQLKKSGVNVVLNSNSPSKTLLEVITKPEEFDSKDSTIRTPKSTPLLTRRELDICQQICSGKSCPEISSYLNISIRTVENHKANIFRKMNVRSCTQMMENAILRGYYTI